MLTVPTLILLRPSIADITFCKMPVRGRCAQCCKQQWQHHFCHHRVSSSLFNSAIITFASISLMMMMSSVTAQMTAAPSSQLLPALTLPTPDLSSMLSPSNLGDYNRLIDCVSKIKGQFTSCNEEAQRKGEAVLKWVDEKSEMGTLLKCCGIWLVRDCWVRAAQKECTDEQVVQLKNMPTKMIPAIQSLCAKYQPGSSGCYTPHLIVGAVALAALLLLLIIVIIVIVVGRHLYRRRRRGEEGSTGELKLQTSEVEVGEGPLHRNRNRNRRSEKVMLTGKSSGQANSGIINISTNNNNLEFIDSSEKVN